MLIRSFFSVFILFLITSSSFGQYGGGYEDLIKKYSDYIELPRELVYLHSNKTTYISGEQLGFVGYVLDKESRQLSVKTTNLYVTLSDDSNQVVKQQLLKVDQGAAVGNFTLDTLLPSGNYVLRSYTNWMNNFKEQNSFVGSIRILNPKNEQNKTGIKETKASMDAQFLPEGGHLVEDVDNTIGVAIKNPAGYGIPLLDGEVRDQDNNVISTFQTNQFGLAKFNLTPKSDQDYTAVVFYNGTDFKFPILKAEPIGFVMKSQRLQNDLKLQFNTNAMSFPLMKNQKHILAIHNGTAIKVIALPDWEGNELVQVVPQKFLYPGINILTVFDSNNKPITERLYFNDKGLSFINAASSGLIKDKDSLSFNLKYTEVDSLSTISISALPAASISYAPNHSIASYTLLSPYIKGVIENGGYYFQDQNERKKNDLDLLLLTQGWSSYDWDIVFNAPPEAQYSFENGINARVIADGKKDRDFLLYEFDGIATIPIKTRAGQSTFQVGGLFPFEGDALKIATLLGKKGNVRPASNLKMTFLPDQIPSISNESDFLFSEEQILIAANEAVPFFALGDNIQQLDEVVVTEKKRDVELEKIQALSHGRVKAVNDRVRRSYGSIENYLLNNGFYVISNFGSFNIINRITGGQPYIYLDGTLVYAPGQLVAGADMPVGKLDAMATVRLEDLDYIDVNKFGQGEGVRGAGGTVRMYSRTDYSADKDKGYSPIYASYDFPLKFTEERKFYIPKYASYSSEFYQQYGVLAWFPKLRPDAAGGINFKIPDTGLKDIQLLVEGITKEGKFISEKINISVDH